MSKSVCKKLIYLYITFCSIGVFAADMGMPVQLRLKSPSGAYPTESGVTIKLQVLSPATGCVLRDEVFSGASIIDGSISLSLGSGTRGTLDPNLWLTQIFDNSTVKNSLSCLDANGAVVATNQSYTPGLVDNRIIRFSTVILGDAVIANFPLKSVAYAMQAEAVGGKTANDILVQKAATQLNQTNLEALLADSTKLGNLQNLANGLPVAAAVNAASANTAINFTGSLTGDISGTQSAVSVDKIKGTLVSSIAPVLGQVLQFDGTKYAPVAIPSAAVSSVAGRTGAVVLANSDISGLGGAAVLNAGTAANNLVQLDAGAKIPSALLPTSVLNSVSDTTAATSANVVSTLMKRDASGNVSLNSASMNNLSSQNLYIYESTNTNRIQIKAPTTFTNYALTLPVSAGTAGQFLSSDGTGNLSWASGTGGGVTSITAGTGLSGGVITATGTIALANTTVTPGTYGAAASVPSFAVDAQGRLTSAANTAIALPASQITQSGALVGQVIKWNGTSWAAAPDANSGGTVTSVTSSNVYLTVTTGTTTPALAVNVGTGTGTLAAGDDGRIIGALQKTAFNSYVASAGCTSTQTMYWNSVSSAFACQTIGTVANATTAVNFTGSLAGDISGTELAVSVDKIKGVPVSATAPTAGQALVYNGTQWVPTKGFSSFVKIAADQSSTLATLVDATGFAFPVVSGTMYKYKFIILYTSSATTNGLRIGLTFPAATIQSATANIPTSTTDGTGFTFSGLISSSGDSVVATNSPAIAPTVSLATIDGAIMPSAAGSVQLQIASEVAGATITIKAASFVEIVEVP